MRNLLLSTLCALSISTFVPPAFAQIVDIKYSDDAQKKFSEEYGEREQPILEKHLRAKATKAVAKNNLQISRIEFTIEKISPNHPTREQANEKPGLDQFRSVSIGGAKISSVAYGMNDEIIAETSVNRFSHSIRDAQYGSTWTDAKQAFGVISNKLAQTIARQS
ncbi:hypothetical protein [Hirschia litorea]|uniref:DUF4410 domain-containing protein n=1 Tax=Hirschia litorea TaxID=1199156 RepID=A0ABW2II29_9PROT